MAELELSSTSRVKPESAYLREFRRDVTSQDGEDGMIERICEVLGIDAKWCVELGAWDGKLHSNTWSLINEHGWGAVLIEGDRRKFAELAERYSGNERVVSVQRVVDFGPGPGSLDAILGATAIPESFDFLSIDVDGCDWHIWSSLSGYRPRLVGIEFNPTIPNHVHFVQDADLVVKQGASLRALIALAGAKGYELVATTRWNAFFVTREEFGKFGIEDNSIDAMHSPEELGSTLFQLYDGTLVLAGCSRLLWHDEAIDPETIQPLLPEKRGYPR